MSLALMSQSKKFVIGIKSAVVMHYKGVHDSKSLKLAPP